VKVGGEGAADRKDRPDGGVVLRLQEQPVVAPQQRPRALRSGGGPRGRLGWGGGRWCGAFIVAVVQGISDCALNGSVRGVRLRLLVLRCCCALGF